MKIQGQCKFETVAAKDLLDGVHTIRGTDGCGIIVPHPGEGPDKLLNWAVHEVQMAQSESISNDRNRLCTDAVLNCRRSLACLVEWYLQRDLASLCKDTPKSPKRQAKFLIARGLINELTSRVVKRAVNIRNTVEHNFKTPDLETTENLVELLRRVIYAIRSESNPAYGPWFFGTLLHSTHYAANNSQVEFHGWSDNAFVFCRFVSHPWMGIIIPKNEVEADIRRLFLDETKLEVFLDVLTAVEQRFGRPSFYSSESTCKLLSGEMGLLDDTCGSGSGL